MTVREPFAFSRAKRYSLAEIASDIGVELVPDAFKWLDPAAQVVHTESGRQLVERAPLELAVGEDRVRHPDQLGQVSVCLGDRDVAAGVSLEREAESADGELAVAAAVPIGHVQREQRAEREPGLPAEPHLIAGKVLCRGDRSERPPGLNHILPACSIRI
jgi:hypothetical protein